MISIFNGRSRSLGTQTTPDIHVQVSTGLRKHLHVFKGAKLSVFMAIALHSDQHGWSRPSTRTLHRETGYNADTIFKALNELCESVIAGHRVLLRRPNRSGDGTFGTNHYLIFPTPEEIAKYETPYLFPGADVSGSLLAATTNGVTVSEKADTAKTRVGESPTRKKTSSGKNLVGKFRHQVDPAVEEEFPFSLFEDLRNEIETHTQQESAPDIRDLVCVKSKFSLDIIRQFAWHSHNEAAEWNARNPRERVEDIRNPNGWAIAAHRSGEFDPIIEEFASERRERSVDRLNFAINAVELAMSSQKLSLSEAIELLREQREFVEGGETLAAAVIEYFVMERGYEFIQTTAA